MKGRMINTKQLIAIRPGSQELVGTRATWDGAITRLQYYSLGQALNIIGRINAVLSHGNMRDKALQQQLCIQLLGYRANSVWTNALQAAKAGTPDEVQFVLFEELALLNLAKLACLTLPVSSVIHEVPVSYLSIAGFMLNTLIDADWSNLPQSEQGTTSAGFRKSLYYMTTRLLANRRPNVVHELARYYDLFCTEKPHLINHPSYSDLPRVIEGHVGLPLDTLLNCSFGLISYFIDIKAGNVHQKNAAIDKDTYFDQLDLSHDELEKFFATVSADATVVCQEIRDAYSIDNMRFHSVLPFAKTPLLTIGSVSVCPSPQLLLAKLTEGLYHLALNSLPSDKRKGFFIYTGRVFEDYVDRLFERLYANSSSVRYISAETIGQAVASLDTQPQTCDAIVVSGNSVVLLEFKAKLFTERMRSGDDEEGFFTRLDEIYFKAAQQLSSTVDLIKSNRLASIGLPHHSNLKLYPVVITLQPFVVTPPLHRYMMHNINSAKLLQQSGVFPFQLIDVMELEIIETLITNKQEKLHTLLERKVSTPMTREHGFFNYYVSQKRINFRDIANPYLSSQYLQLAERAEGYFRSKLSTE